MPDNPQRFVRKAEPQDGEVAIAHEQLLIRVSRINWGHVRVDRAYVTPHSEQPINWVPWTRLRNDEVLSRHISSTVLVAIAAWVERTKAHDLNDTE